jgi:RNA polymerase sigma-70 factor (ECF subfamily)
MDPVTPDQDHRHRAFLRHYAGCSERLRAYVLALVYDRDAAEDAVQELALTLWERFDDYDPGRPFLHWARGVARFKIMKAWQSQQRRLPQLSTAALDGLEAAWQTADAEPMVALEVLNHCLDQVPERGRDLLRLRYHEGLAMESIAARLRSSVTAVTKSLSRLRGRLADCVSNRLQRDGLA